MTTLETILLILVIVMFLSLMAMMFFIFKKNKIATPTNDQSVINIQLEDLKKQFLEINRTLQESKVDSGKGIAELNQRVEGMDKFQRELNKFNQEIKTNLDNINSAAKNIPSISVELKDIADIYKHAKKRGNFGEFQLRTILNDIFGVNSNLVKEQHQLRDGVVDFAIQINENIVPIDSKFPLDNYKKVNDAKTKSEIKEARTLFKRDIVNKFKEVEKYVYKPDGINNVIIFIPSEAIFGDIVD
jgi:DNA recombination protein RmuC